MTIEEYIKGMEGLMDELKAQNQTLIDTIDNAVKEREKLVKSLKKITSCLNNK